MKSDNINFFSSKNHMIFIIAIVHFCISCFASHMKGAGTTESTLIEIFSSRSSRQIKALSEAYLAGLCFSTSQNFPIIVKQIIVI